MPLAYDHTGRPVADVTIDGVRIDDMLLDTGGTYTVVGHREVSLLQAYVLDSAQDVGLCTIDGCSETGAFLSSVNEVCLFGACAANVEIKYPVWNALVQPGGNNIPIRGPFSASHEIRAPLSNW